MTKVAKVKPSGKRLENEAIAKARYIKGGERKLNLLAQLIRGKSAAKALIDLEFSQRRVAREVKKVLEAAIANAENNHNLDVDRLFIKEAIVGKTMVMGRLHTRGRGRSAPIEKPFCNITIRVQERAAEEAKVKKAKGEKKEGKAPAAKAEKKSDGKKAADKKQAE
ncbi:MAG: 50S ribosomal protein L22 [bacterium]|nr:50S ribosomal protein L22 [bacterium]